MRVRQTETEEGYLDTLLHHDQVCALVIVLVLHRARLGTAQCTSQTSNRDQGIQGSGR